MGTGVDASAERQVTRQKAMEALDRVPKLSPATTRLLARLARPNCEIPELAALIEHDPVLAGQVLQVANSAVFARRSHVGSVRHALAMVGLNTIRKFALARSVTNLFSRCRMAEGFSVTRFNLHSVATGTVMELLTDEVPIEDAGDAFFAGLFHDVGKLLIAASMPQAFQDVLMLESLTANPQIQCEHEILGLDHAELSGLAIRRWGLAEPVLFAAIDHHQPPPVEPGKKIPLSLAVQQADAMVNRLGMSVMQPRMTTPEAPEIQFDGYQVDHKRLFHRFEREWKSFSNLFD